MRGEGNLSRAYEPEAGFLAESQCFREIGNGAVGVGGWGLLFRFSKFLKKFSEVNYQGIKLGRRSGSRPRYGRVLKGAKGEASGG